MYLRSTLSHSDAVSAIELFEQGRTAKSVALTLDLAPNPVQMLYERWQVRGSGALMTRDRKQYDIETKLLILRRHLQGVSGRVLAKEYWPSLSRHRHELDENLPARRCDRCQSVFAGCPFDAGAFAGFPCRESSPKPRSLVPVCFCHGQDLVFFSLAVNDAVEFEPCPPSRASALLGCRAASRSSRCLCAITSPAVGTISPQVYPYMRNSPSEHVLSPVFEGQSQRFRGSHLPFGKGETYERRSSGIRHTPCLLDGPWYGPPLMLNPGAGAAAAQARPLRMRFQ